MLYKTKTCLILFYSHILIYSFIYPINERIRAEISIIFMVNIRVHVCACMYARARATVHVYVRVGSFT